MYEETRLELTEIVKNPNMLKFLWLELKEA